MTALRLIHDDGASARRNIALTAAIAELHAEGEIPDTLRIYRYPLAVLLGRNQDAGHAADLAECGKRNVELARRVTGGGAIYMDRGVITWDLVISRRAAGSDLRKLSEAVCSAIAGSLIRLGVNARFRPDNDIVADGRKLAGASGYADGVSLVHQGSLMIAPDLAAMAATLRMRSPEEQVTALSRLLGRDVHDAEVTTLLAQSIASALGRSLQRASLTSEEIARSEELFVRELGDENFVLHGDAARPPAAMPGVAA